MYSNWGSAELQLCATWKFISKVGIKLFSIDLKRYYKNEAYEENSDQKCLLTEPKILTDKSKFRGHQIARSNWSEMNTE